MKNKYFSFVALAAAALATSCASDDLAEQKQEQTGTRTVTLTASVNEGQTRVGMTKGDNNTASFYWHKNDAISVLTTSGETFSNAKFTTTADNGATSATFTGTVASGNELGTYAVYPYNESHSFTGEKALTYNLPKEYTNYTLESKIFGTTGDYRSNPTNIPMLGTITTGDNDSKSIKFKCLGGLAVIRIDKMPVESGTLVVTASQKLWGDFEVADLADSEAKITTTTASDTDGEVSIAFSGATSGGVGVFYLPLATGTYENFRINIEVNGTFLYTVTYGTVTISRAGVTAIPLYNNNGKLQKNPAYIDKGGHTFVDLGLSVLWAETNVYQSSYNICGDYISYGDLSYQSNLSMYQWDDCRLPSQSEFEELKNEDNCNWTWTYENNVYGYKITSKVSGYEGNSIFLPAAGYEENYSSQSQGTAGYYWYKNEDYYSDGGDTSNGSCFTFSESSKEFTTASYSCSVRAVAEK